MKRLVLKTLLSLTALSMGGAAFARTKSLPPEASGLRSDGVVDLSFPEFGKQHLKISTKEVLLRYPRNPGSKREDFGKVVPLTEAKDANDVLRQLSALQKRDNAVYEVILEGDGQHGSGSKYPLTRRMSAKVPTRVDEQALVRPLGALHAHRPYYDVERVIFSFPGPVDALLAAERIKQMVPSVKQAAPILQRLHVETRFTPNDPIYGSDQWHVNPLLQSLGYISTEPAWDLSKGDLVRISLVDDGCNIEHTDLRSSTTAGFNLITEDNELNGVGFAEHGTRVAGIIGAKQHNRIGVSGVAPRCRMSPLVITIGGTEAPPYRFWRRKNSQKRLPTSVSQALPIIPGGWIGPLLPTRISGWLPWRTPCVARGAGGV
jgi:hypothetical protein